MASDSGRWASLLSCVPAPLRRSSQVEAISMAGKFVLKKNLTGKYHFNLLASNAR